MAHIKERLDFSKELDAEPRLKDFLYKAMDEFIADNHNKLPQIPVLDKSNKAITIIYGLPSVGKDKQEKLMNVIVKLCQLAEAKLEGSKILFQFNKEKTMTSGVCLIDFKDSNSAVAAAEFFNNYKLDANHILTSYTKSQVDDLGKLPEEFVEPTIISEEEYSEWIADSKFRDQICILSETEASIYWFSHLEKEMMHYKTIPMNEAALNFEWSPNGKLLVVFFEDYVEIYGGKEMQKIGKYNHEKISKIIYSPNEHYMISYNDSPRNLKNRLMKNENYIVWCIRTGRKVRSFQGDEKTIFSWSHDSKYLAKAGDDTASVYGLPSMELLRNEDGAKKSLDFPYAKHVSFINGLPVLILASYSDPDEESDSKSLISLVNVETRKNFKKWTSFNYEIQDAEFFSSPNGKLIMGVLKKTISKKGFRYFIQYVNYAGKSPQFVENEVTGSVKEFAVDGKNLRTAYILSGVKSSANYLAYVHNLDWDNFNLGKTEVPTNCSKILLSGIPSYFLLFDDDKDSLHRGTVEFYSINANNKGELIKSLNLEFSDIKYDASGRFVVIQTKTATKINIQIYDCLGELILKDSIYCKGIEIRNHPLLKLSDREIKDIGAEVTAKKKEFQKNDDKIMNSIKYEREQRTEKLKEEFLEFLAGKEKLWNNSHSERKKYLGFDDECPKNLVEVEIIETTEIIQ